LSVRLFQLVNQRFYAIQRKELFVVPQNIAANVLQMIKNAAQIYDLNGAIEGTLRTKMLHADFLELMGDLPSAKKIAGEVRPVAEAMSYVRISERARDLLEDNTTLMEFERDWKAHQETDVDVEFSQYNDDQLAAFAKETMRIDQLPAGRLPIVEEYCKSLRDIAYERAHWCRHMMMLENLKQTREPATAFVIAPDRKCVCEKHSYETKIVTSHAGALVQSMKQVHCTGCSDRSPKI
jgi:cell fate (sporulation/competence/biofilm development) regulator YmcA (YheA/YmcA/DUF963 family)